MDEMVSAGDEHRNAWMPNHRGFGARFDPYGSGSDFELTAEHIQAALEKLQNRYAPFVAHMQEKFPGLKVEPKFGVLAYYR